MSSPHHHHHHTHPHPHPHPHSHPHHHYYSSCCSSSSSSSYCSSAASCCCCCCCCNSSSPPPSLPPPLSNAAAAATDPLLHALANHLLLLQSPKPSPPPPPPPPPPPLYSYPHLKPYPSPQTHQPPPHDHHHQQQLLHSLLSRISALESSLPHLSTPPHPPPLHAHSKRSPSPNKHLFSPPPPPPPPKTLQDLAARTIQTHFRLFLVRRSQTLRHLKRLASIKSHVAALRSSLSDKTHLHPAALYESAMALLLELDAIQGGDPMIREGKRSISRELTRILDFVDKVLVKEKELMEIAENAYEVIPPTRTGKKVSFFEKEKEKRSPVSSASHEPLSENIHLSRRSRRDSGENRIDGSHHQLNSDDEEDDDDDEEEEEENSSESSKAKLGLSAPLPLQMEPRRLTASR